MAFAPYAACLKKLVKGGFKEAKFGHWFEYAEPEAGEFLPFPGYETKVYVGGIGGAEFRWAKVVATRAYVVVEEGAAGEPVVATWIIRGHRKY